MDLKNARERLAKIQAKHAAYAHALEIISYDGMTTAPKGTAQNRARALSVLTEDIYKMSTSKNTEKLLEALDARKDELTEAEKRQVFLLLNTSSSRWEILRLSGSHLPKPLARLQHSNVLLCPNPGRAGLRQFHRGQ